MKIFFSVASTIVMCVFTSLAHAAGVLVEANGAVDVTIGGKKAAATVGLELPDGSKVKANGGGSAQVMLLDGSIFKIAAGQTFDVGPNAKPAGQKTVIQGIQLALNEASTTGQGPTVHGMIKMGAPGVGRAGGLVIGSGTIGIAGLFPVSTTIEPVETITFRWKSEPKIDWANPVLVIEDATNHQLKVTPIPAGATSVTVACQAAGLTPGGSYRWHLGSKTGATITVKGSHFPFQILGGGEAPLLAADLAQVENLGLTSSNAKALLTGQLYYKYKLYEKMVETLIPVYQSSGGDAVKKLLYVGFLRMGLTDEMKKYQ